MTQKLEQSGAAFAVSLGFYAGKECVYASCALYPFVSLAPTTCEHVSDRIRRSITNGLGQQNAAFSQI